MTDDMVTETPTDTPKDGSSNYYYHHNSANGKVNDYLYEKITELENNQKKMLTLISKLVEEIKHPNYYEFLNICNDIILSNGYIDADVFQDYINENTKLVVLSHSSNIIGSIQPIRKLSEICRKKSIHLLKKCSSFIFLH